MLSKYASIDKLMLLSKILDYLDNLRKISFLGADHLERKIICFDQLYLLPRSKNSNCLLYFLPCQCLPDSDVVYKYKILYFPDFCWFYSIQELIANKILILFGIVHGFEGHLACSKFCILSVVTLALPLHLMVFSAKLKDNCRYRHEDGVLLLHFDVNLVAWLWGVVFVRYSTALSNTILCSLKGKRSKQISNC